MSKRSRKAAERRLVVALFGEDGLVIDLVSQPTQKQQLLNQAQRLRDLADRGMHTRKYNREAAALECEALALGPEGKGVER